MVEDINKSAGKAFAFSADVTKKEEVTSVFDEIHKQFGAAQILIYNAASKFELKGICDINADNFIESWKINCLGGLLTTQCVLPQMVEKKNGTIIFSGATAALRGGARMANFAVGKFSQRAIAQSMAREFGPLGIHVVHVVIDGQIATPAVLEYFPDRPLDTFLNPTGIADVYWELYKQDKTTWTHEIDLRPSVEKF